MSPSTSFNVEDIPYNRFKAIEYAHQWAFARNPSYYNFDGIGGDCTNFVSQCLFAGAKVMNYSTTLPWYYTNGYQKSPSWTGVDFLFQFLIHNQGVGPHGTLSNLQTIFPGDVVQLSFLESGRFHHSGLIVEVGDPPGLENILIATHTYDSDFRPLNSYSFQRVRFLNIQGVRKKI